MAKDRLSMRKFKEILRLKFDHDLTKNLRDAHKILILLALSLCVTLKKRDALHILIFDLCLLHGLLILCHANHA